ncbi:MAG TPA: hypothetical protein VKK31_10450 [Thermoanaerobaculia bacterium]|nr:hypothetical protein [Thermoanaerobaculia bacterium]
MQDAHAHHRADNPFRLPGRLLLLSALAAGALAMRQELRWGLLPIALVFGWGQMGGQ